MGDKHTAIRRQLGGSRRVIGGSFAIGCIATVLTAFICYFGYAIFQPDWLQSSIGVSVPLIVPALVAPPVAALVYHFTDTASAERTLRHYLAQELDQEIRRRRRLEAQVAQLSKRDPLTGLSSRGHLWETARQAIARSRRNNRPLTVAMVGIDNFHDVQNEHGDAAADTLLCEVAKICAASLREVDMIGRATDTTFAILLEDTDREAAKQVAIRLRRLVNNRTTGPDTQQVPASISMGITEIALENQSFDDAVGIAEGALGSARKAGMGQICLVSAPVREAAPPPQEPGEDRAGDVVRPRAATPARAPAAA